VEARTVEIRLVLQVNEDELQGRIVGPGTEDHREFRGWLGLIGALDGLIDGTTPRSSLPTTSTERGGRR
jgi:hypothetical protein